MTIEKMRKALADADIIEGIDYFVVGETIHLYSASSRRDPPTVGVFMDPHVKVLEESISHLISSMDILMADLPVPKIETDKRPYYRRTRRKYDTR